MIFPKQSLIDFLTAVYDLLRIGLSEKQALDISDDYLRFKHSYGGRIRRDIENGIAFIEAISNLLYLYSFIVCESYNVSLRVWLKFKISELQQKRDTFLLVLNMSIRPFFLMLISLLLNGFIVIQLIPKIIDMLDQFNTPLPMWLALFQHASIAIYNHGLFFLMVFFCVGLLCFYPISRLIQHILGPIKIDFMVQDFLAMIASLHGQGMSLKEIARSVSVRVSSVSSDGRFESFRSLILKDHSYQKAFHVLLQHKHHEYIIEQGIVSDTLQDALMYVIGFYRDKFICFMKRLSLGVTIGLTSFTAVSIMIGFYITLQPFIQLLEHAL